MYYECLGNNTYRINLKMYRDCQNAQPGATFPDPAVIFVFESATKQPYLELYFSAPSNPPQVIPDNWSACTGQPYTLCIEEGIYTGTVVLPPRTGGYDIGFAVCCRNNIITNLANPTCDGVTFLNHIPDPGDAVCNTMPTFDQRPSLFLCAGMQYNFDHSATDPDGDSLVYAITNPYTGLNFAGWGAGNPGGFPCSPGQPNPQVNNLNPMGAPPYMNVTFGTGYSHTNPFGNGSISIDPQTGWLTAQPMSPGVYVFAVSVFEYRNGKLLSENKRDFQFHVITCQPQGAPPVITPNLAQLEHSNDTIFAEAATPFCFDFTVQDTGAFSTLLVAPVSVAFGGNGGFPAPFASINMSGTNPITGQVCWRPSCSLAGQTIPIMISARDSSDCPNYNIALDTIYITIKPAVAAPPVIWHDLGGLNTNGDTILLQVKENFCFDFFIVDTTGWGGLTYEDEIQDTTGKDLNEVHTISTTISGDTLFGQFCWQSYCNIGMVYQLILHGIDTNKCPPGNESLDTIYIRVLAPATFTPVVSTDLSGLSLSGDTVLAWVHEEFCFDFLVVDTSGTADSILITTELLDMQGDSIGGRQPTVSGPLVGDSLFGDICWQPSCEHVGMTFRLVVHGIQAAKCWVLTEANDTIYVRVRMQTKPPPVVTHDFSGLQLNGDTVLFYDRDPFCYGFTVEDNSPPTYLEYEAHVFDRDGNLFPGTQPSLNYQQQSDSLLTGDICWSVDCEDGGKEFMIIMTAKDTFDCDLQNTITDTVFLRHVETVPERIPVCNASVNEGDKTVDINWNYNPGPDFGYIILERRAIQESNFFVIDTVYNVTTTAVTDKTGLNADEVAYCYRLTPVDLCGNKGPVSDEVCTMVLKGERDEYNSELNWTLPQGLPGGNTSMEVFSNLTDDPQFFDVLVSLNPNDQFYTHLDVPNAVQCYRIRTFANSPECTLPAWSNEVCITFPPKIYFPNAFTPNNDGLNDELTFPNKFVQDFHFMVFDRWGKLIFESLDINQGWDGRFPGGGAAPEGVYMYNITGAGYDGTRFDRKGSITLIR